MIRDFEQIKNISGAVREGFDLQLFAFTQGQTPGTPVTTNVNVTTSQGMEPTMKEFYDTSLLENAKENMVFAQFALRQPTKGKSVEWRKFKTFAPAIKPLTEGVVPEGKTFGMDSVKAEITQHGDYVAVSDRLEMEAFDDVIYGCTEEMGGAEGETFDTLTRNSIVGGNSVYYAPRVTASGESEVTSRKDITADCKLTSKMVNVASTILRKNKTPTIDGSYIAIIHPSVVFDVRQDPDFIDVAKYANSDAIFNREIGKLHSVRFVETTNAKVFGPGQISDGYSRLTVKTAVTSAGKSMVVDQVLTAATPAKAIPVYVNGAANTITKIETSSGSTTITLSEAVTAAVGDVICGQGAGKDGSAVYATLFFGKDAYGIVDPEGEGQEMIIKSREQIGGPLNQFSTVGYKFCHAAKILYQERLLRVESGSRFSGDDEEN